VFGSGSSSDFEQSELAVTSSERAQTLSQLEL